MAKQEPVSPLSAEHTAPTAATPPLSDATRGAGKARPPAVFYVGFETTREGREYTLRVSDGVAARLFVLLITHEAFASRAARFQDAPDLCFGKLQRELVADPDLLPGSRLELTAQELLDYRAAGERRPPGRKRRQPGR